MTIRLFRVLAAAALMLAACVCIAAPSNYEGLRDPFQRPDRKPNVGEAQRPGGSGKAGDWEAGQRTPRSPTNKPPTTPAAKPDTLASIAGAYLEAQLRLYDFVRDVWRPVLVFTAGEVKSVAIEKATIAFRDISHAYLVGAGWAKTSLSWLGPKVISGLFNAYSILEPSDLDPGSELNAAKLPVEEQALRNHLKKLDQRVKEEPSAMRMPWPELPEVFRGPASLESPVNVSTEEQRRRAIFADPSVSRDQARLLLAKAAGGIYGPVGEQLTAGVLWLYDIDRIREQGLSQEAMDFFYELERLARLVRARPKAANACLISPPAWQGDPRTWACTLPYTAMPTDSCFCPTPPPLAQTVSGVPKRFGHGMTCNVRGVGVCPMLHSQPIGTFCGCTGYPGVLGQVR